MGRPKIKIRKTPLDWCIEIAGLLLVLVYWLIVLLNYFKLPEIIPMHYNALGEIDGWGGKSTLLVLPVLSTAMYIGITFLQKVPHFFNYANIEITEHNAERLYTIAVRMISILKLSMVAIFVLLTILVLQDALKTFWFVKFWMILAMFGADAIIIIYFLKKMYAAR